jgi:DNA-binding IclR family transcriptional regulator
MPRSATAASAKRTNYNIQAVDKALDLLSAICDDGGEVRLIELSRRLGLNKENVFRLLATLENRGLVARGDDVHKYRLGVSAYEMGQKLLLGMGLVRKSRPVMEWLARECGESVYLVVPSRDEALMLEMADSGHPIKVAPMIGRRFPLTANSLGQIFLPWRQPGTRGDKETTIPNELHDRLTLIRQLGYTEEENVLGEGVTSFGTPIFNAQDQVVAAFAIIGPSFRIFTEKRRKELIPLVIDAGTTISTSLGYLPPQFRCRYAS